MFFLLYKPKGISSAEAVNRFKRSLNLSRVGHSGTLDPLASGALLVATDADTKLLEFISSRDKYYEVVMRLCVSSDTLDITGELSQVEGCQLPTIGEIYQAFEVVAARESQIPPAFSAKKQAGVRAYKLARSKQQVNLNPVPFKVYWWQLTGISLNEVRFKIKVSEGGYIRSFVRDVGIELGCQATMSQLYRYRVGGCELRAKVELLSERELFLQDRVVINPRQARLIWDGKLGCIGTIKGLVALEFKGSIIGFCEGDAGGVKLRKLLGRKLARLLEVV